MCEVPMVKEKSRYWIRQVATPSFPDPKLPKPIFRCNSGCGYPNALQNIGHLCLVMMNNEWKNEVNCIFHSWEILRKRLRIFGFNRVPPAPPRPNFFIFYFFLIFSIIPFNISKKIDNLRQFSFLYSTTLRQFWEFWEFQ